MDPRPGMKLITPSGKPASLSICMIRYGVYTQDEAGLRSTVLPMIAGAVARFPAMAVKLNGASANTKPSRRSKRTSLGVHVP